MAVAVLKIGGTPRPMRVGSLSVIENVTGRSTLVADIVSATGAYTPSVDDAVVLEDGSANVLFGGFVTEPQKRWLLQGSGVLTTITCSDYTALADRRLVKGATTGGVTVRDIVDAIIAAYLGAYGVTRDPAMATGSTVGALDYDYVTVTDVFNDLTKLASGWLWRIDHNKVLRAFQPGVGTYPCPFSMTVGSSKIAGGDIAITRTRQGYANQVRLIYGDGTSTPALATANELTEQGLYGIYETAIRSAGPFDAGTAQDVADAFLAKAVSAPRTIMFTTRTPGARAGQTLTINLPSRVVGDFLITEVEITDFDGVQLFYRITAVEGDIVGASWKDTFASWSGTSSGVVSTSVTVVTSVVGRSSYFLGGSGIAAEQSAGPSVINAVGYIDVELDSTAYPAGTSVTAVVQCKTASAGVGVTPQVYNVTNGTVAGTGSTVVGTSWTTVTFAITVATGVKTYRLRMTPNTANVNVYTLGYLEVGR